MYRIPINETEVEIIEALKPFLEPKSQKVIDKFLTFLNIFNGSTGRLLNENALSRFLALMEGESLDEEIMTVKTSSKAKEIIDLIEAVLKFTGYYDVMVNPQKTENAKNTTTSEDQ